MAAMTDTSHELFTCPACNQPVRGTLSLSVALGEVRDKEVEAKATVTGLRVSHDCIPKVTRGDQYRATWNGEPATRSFEPAPRTTETEEQA